MKWFCTYTCADPESRPTFKGESEVSVYDLKDHPDFQYRPGTIVIRVANYGDEKGLCTAGQVIDNYVDGFVQVWWVDGHISNCWPQDLFEVGQYDSENNFWSNDDSDNDSWETEDETSELGGVLADGKEVSKPQLVANLERARVAMAKLEEIFVINPNLQNQNVMKKLLIVYKKCRYLDRLMGTSFFHEEHFQGLVERVRKGGNPSTAERVRDQKIRLFNDSAVSLAATEIAVTFIRKIKLLDTKSESNSHEETSCSSYGSCKTSASCNGGCGLSTSPKLLNPLSSGSGKVFNISTSSDISSIDENEVSGKTAKEEDSGFSGKFSESDSSTEYVCARLCVLIKAQLVKALQEINTRYGQKDVIIEEYSIEDVSPEEVVLPPEEIAAEAVDVVLEPAIAESSAQSPVPDAFQILDSAPHTHKFHLTVFNPTNTHEFYKAVMKEHRMLQGGLPAGVWVKRRGSPRFSQRND